MAPSQFIALTRGVSPSVAKCELTHLARVPLDLSKAVSQHQNYERLLTDLGAMVETLPADPALPDCLFIEDTAVVTDEFALITRPGAPSRRAEVNRVAEALGRYRKINVIQSPGILDGGDVLKLGRRFYVGLGSRTNREGIDQLTRVSGPFGYTVQSVPIDRCLHLKSAVTEIGEGRILLNPDWIPKGFFSQFERIEVDKNEPFGANALRMGDTLVYPSSYPRTYESLIGLGLKVRTVDISELAKAEAGVTCCSLLFNA